MRAKLRPDGPHGISGNFFYSRIDATALGIPGLQSTTGLKAKAKLDYRPLIPIQRKSPSPGPTSGCRASTEKPPALEYDS
jgi:hypothetical protein